VARLRHNGLITRRPHANTYDPIPEGLAFATIGEPGTLLTRAGYTPFAALDADVARVGRPGQVPGG
jgi:hypothetical protein